MSTELISKTWTLHTLIHTALYLQTGKKSNCLFCIHLFFRTKFTLIGVFYFIVCPLTRVSKIMFLQSTREWERLLTVRAVCDLWCIFRWTDCKKNFPQRGQSYFFSLLWVNLCRFRSPERANNFQQCEQSCFSLLCESTYVFAGHQTVTKTFHTVNSHMLSQRYEPFCASLRIVIADVQVYVWTLIICLTGFFRIGFKAI